MMWCRGAFSNAHAFPAIKNHIVYKNQLDENISVKKKIDENIWRITIWVCSLLDVFDGFEKCDLVAFLYDADTWPVGQHCKV